MPIDFPPIVSTTSPSAHPAMLTPEAKALGPEHAVLTSAQETLATVYSTLGAVTAASTAAHAEQGVKSVVEIQNAKRIGNYPPGAFMNKAGQIVMPLEAASAIALNDAITNAFDVNCTPKLDASMKLAEQRVAALETEIKNFMTDSRENTPAGINFTNKVHDHLQKMATEGERTAWVLEKINSLDLRSTSAVINYLPEFTGINAKTLTLLRVQAEAKFLPPQVEELKQVRSIQSKLKHATEAGATHVKNHLVEIRAKQQQSVASLNKLRELGKAKA